jgi:hypothetical protein
MGAKEVKAPSIRQHLMIFAQRTNPMFPLLVGVEAFL